MKKTARISLASLALSGAVGAFVGTGLYTLDYAEGTSYLSSDPRACANCHVMREHYQAWQHSSHHAVATCNDCHVPEDPVGKYLTKMVHGWRHSKAFTLQNFEEPIRIRPEDLDIVRNNCRRCHQELTSEIDHPFASAHSSENADCVHCHFGVGHGPVK